MIRQMAMGIGLVALIAAPGVAQPRPLKVLVLYDMEGVTGATSVRHTSYDEKAEYEAARQSLTADVNAASRDSRRQGRRRSSSSTVTDRGMRRDRTSLSSSSLLRRG